MRARRHRQIVCALAIACLLLLLSCGTGVIAVYERAIVLPRTNVRLGPWRVMAYTQTIRTKPPQHFFIVWVFERPAQLGPSAPFESGRQLLQIALKD